MQSPECQLLVSVGVLFLNSMTLSRKKSEYCFQVNGGRTTLRTLKRGFLVGYSTPICQARVELALYRFKSYAAISKRRICAADAMSSAGSLSSTLSPRVVLISGGVESSVLLRLVHSSSPPGTVRPLFMNYSQRAAYEEYEACLRQCESISDLQPLIDIDIRDAGDTVRKLDVYGARAHVPLPHRNLSLLAMSVSAAAKLNATSIHIALSADDTEWYPSASPTFLDAFRTVITALEPGLTLYTPLIDMTKPQIVKLGTSIGVKWKDTYSCMIGSGRRATCTQWCKNIVDTDRVNDCPEHANDSTQNERHIFRLEHCGRCPQCKARRSAFASAGVPDGTNGFYKR